MSWELMPLQGCSREECRGEREGTEGEVRGSQGMRGREGSFVIGKEGTERGKIVKNMFAAGRSRLRDEEHGVHDQDWAELAYKEGKIDSISRSQIEKMGQLFSRYQWVSLQAEKMDSKE